MYRPYLTATEAVDMYGVTLYLVLSIVKQMHASVPPAVCSCGTKIGLHFDIYNVTFYLVITY
jgi:hypothetical protein